MSVWLFESTLSVCLRDFRDSVVGQRITLIWQRYRLSLPVFLRWPFKTSLWKGQDYKRICMLTIILIH